MPRITQSITPEYLAAYNGFDRQAVGLGLIQPNIYATPDYQKRKINTMAIGLISDIRYAGFENDPNPKVLAMRYIPQYNMIMGYNLRYGTPKLRQAILKFVLESNAVRIQNNQPIMIDYESLKRAVPDSQYLVRNYKVVGIGVKETYNLNEWVNLINQKSPYDGYYTQFKS